MAELALTGLTVPEVAAAFESVDAPSRDSVDILGTPVFFDSRVVHAGRGALVTRWAALGEDDASFIEVLSDVGRVAGESMPHPGPFYRVSRQTSDSILWFSLFGDGRLCLFPTGFGTFGLWAQPSGSLATSLTWALTGAEDELITVEKYEHGAAELLVHHDSQTRWGPVNSARESHDEPLTELLGRLAGHEWFPEHLPADDRRRPRRPGSAPLG